MGKQGPGGLLDAILAESARSNSNACTVGIALAKLEPADAAALVEAMALPKDVAKHTVITKHLANLSGMKLLDQTVGRHRAGKCSCVRAD